MPEHDGRAWSEVSAPPEAAWRYEVPSDVLTALLTGSTGNGRLRDFSSQADGFVEGVARALEQGPGFAVLHGIPTGRGRDGDARSCYLRLGSEFGVPIVQDREGTLLCDVIDAGFPLEGEADHPGSRRVDLPFHTDNAWGRIFPDYMGLLCLRNACDGGLMQMVSAYTLLEELERVSPGYQETLRLPVPFDPARQLQAGEEAHDEIAITEWSDETGLTFRYLHYQIASDHLSTRQREAIAALEEILLRPELRVRLVLQPGEVLMVNNRWVLHSRTRYENEPGLPRCHVRLWLERIDSTIGRS
jgi:hypothetical protein